MGSDIMARFQEFLTGLQQEATDQLRDAADENDRLRDENDRLKSKLAAQQLKIEKLRAAIMQAAKEAGDF